MNAAWTELSPSVTTGHLTDVMFVDSSYGWAIGYGGLIIHSTDGGLSWTRQHTASAMQLTALWFCDRVTGYVVGSSPPRMHFVLRTTDGGQHWTSVNSNFDERLLDVAFLDARQGYVIGAAGLVAVTNNSGHSWDIERIRQDFRPMELDVWPPEHVWIVGALSTDPSAIVIARTVSSGQHWDQTILHVPDGSLAHVRSIDFSSSSKGWALGSWDNWFDFEDHRVPLSYGSLRLTTVDGGITWSAERFDRTVAGPIPRWANASEVEFVDESMGWLTGSDFVSQTTDGGQNWSENSLPVANRLRAGSFPAGGTGCVVGEYGTILRKPYGTLSWEKISPKHELGYLHSIEFGDALNGWIGSDGGLFETENGGRIWSRRVGPEGDIYMFHWVDQSLAFGYARYSRFYRTTDAGVSWEGVEASPWVLPLHMSFVDSLTGWISSYNGQVWHTQDGSRSWIKQRESEDPGAPSIEFVSPNVGWCTYGKQIDQTTDGGFSWQTLPPLPISSQSLDFLDSLLGWMVGDRGLVYASSDGGVSWHLRYDAPETWLTTVKAVDAATIWASGSGGVVLSTDGGTSWKRTIPPTYYALRTLDALDGTQCWLLGTDRTIYSVLVQE